MAFLKIRLSDLFRKQALILTGVSFSANSQLKIAFFGTYSLYFKFNKRHCRIKNKKSTTKKRINNYFEYIRYNLLHSKCFTNIIAQNRQNETILGF